MKNEESFCTDVKWDINIPAPLNPGVPRAIALTSTSSAIGLSCIYSSRISWRPRTSGLGTTI